MPKTLRKVLCVWKKAKNQCRKLGRSKRAHLSGPVSSNVVGARSFHGGEGGKENKSYASPSLDEKEAAAKGLASTPVQTLSGRKSSKVFARLKKIAEVSSAVVVLGVESTDAIADAFPPVKSVTAGLLYVKDIVQVCFIFL